MGRASCTRALQDPALTCDGRRGPGTLCLTRRRGGALLQGGGGGRRYATARHQPPGAARAVRAWVPHTVWSCASTIKGANRCVNESGDFGVKAAGKGFSEPTTSGDILFSPHECVLKMLRFLWRIQIWAKNTKNIFWGPPGWTPCPGPRALRFGLTRRNGGILALRATFRLCSPR